MNTGIRFEPTGRNLTAADKAKVMAKVHARLEYECACVRAACGPDRDRKNDYREIIRAHESYIGKPLDQWDIEELEKATEQVKRRW